MTDLRLVGPDGEDPRNEVGPPLRVLCCGSRTWDDPSVIELVLRGVNSLAGELNRRPVVIEGEANGADTMAREAAEALDIEVLRMPADWDKHGRKAGHIRNIEMLDQKPHLVVAFADDVKNSTGTNHMCRIAKRQGIPVYVVSRY